MLNGGFKVFLSFFFALGLRSNRFELNICGA